jgi:CBS domain-containing protein
MEEQSRQPAKGEFQAMYSPLGSLIRRQPVTVPLNATVRQAIEIMDEKRIGSIIIADAEGKLPLGIFTLHDLLHRVALPSCALDLPIAAVMTAGVITVKPQATAYQAALIMARRGLHHLLVVDEAGGLIGIVSQNDLFALQRTGVNDVTSSIREARDLAALQDCSKDIGRMGATMLEQGVAADQLTHLISTLNDLLTLRIIELTHDEFDLPQVKWCWVAFGSEGRYEQTLSTDQDNGIIFETEAGDVEQVRRSLLPFAESVNRKLDACGFPLCKGNVMASNPELCLSLDEWQARFRGWLHAGNPQALLNATIYFDFRPLYGDERLAERLRQWLLDRVPGAPLFQRLMAEIALQTAPPLALFRDFSFDGNAAFPHTLDLKASGARLFVDAARILALAAGIGETGTAQRLRALGEAGKLGRDDVGALVDGFFLIQRLRLRVQQENSPAGAANRVDPETLNELDRHVLKEAFRQARKLQERLRLEYRL